MDTNEIVKNSAIKANVKYWAAIAAVGLGAAVISRVIKDRKETETTEETA